MANKKLVYEVTRQKEHDVSKKNEKWGAEYLVFHIKGDPKSFDTAMSVKMIKENPNAYFKTELEFVEWAELKSFNYGIGFEANVDGLDYKYKYFKKQNKKG